MNQNLDSTFIPFPTPADPAEDSAGGDPKRGRKSGYAPKIIDMMCDQIRRFGLSDSAAAEQVGMSSSTVSRWKQLYPEIGPKLQQARQEIRIHHLEIIEQAAAAENGRGWRASAWILERLFPVDYARKISDRSAALNLEDRLKDREAHEALEVQLKELHAMQDAERAEREERAAAQAAAAAEAEAREAASSANDEAPITNAEVIDGNPAAPRAGIAAFHSEEASQNSRNSEEASSSANDQARMTNDAVINAIPAAPRAEIAAFHSEEASQNSRNSEEAASSANDEARMTNDEVNNGNPAAPHAGIAAFYSEEASHYSRNAGEAEWPGKGEVHAPHSQQAAEGPEFVEGATSAKRQQAAAVQGDAASESDSRNSPAGPRA
jgi:hypothetical protein